MGHPSELRTVPPTLPLEEGEIISMFDVTDAARDIEPGGHRSKRRVVHWELIFPPAPYQRHPVDRRRSRKMLTLLTAAAPLVALTALSSQAHSQPADTIRPRSGGGHVPARRHSAVARNVNSGSSSEGQTRRYFLG